MRFILRPNSLFLKAILVISLILIIAISLRVWLNVRLHERSIARANHEKAKIISEFIEKNVIRAMEKGRHFEIHRILKNFAYEASGRSISSGRMERSKPRPLMRS